MKRLVEWRRRESNESPHFPNCKPGHNFRNEPPALTVFWKCSEGTASHDLTLPDVSENGAIIAIAAAWPFLPPHIRETILTLVDAAQVKSPVKEISHELS